MHAYDESTDYDGMTRHGICRLQKGEFSKAGIMRLQLHLTDFPFLPRQILILYMTFSSPQIMSEYLVYLNRGNV